MALNDNFSIVMGNSNDTRQPSSGVFEKVTNIMKEGSTDGLIMTNATLDTELLGGGTVTGAQHGTAASTRQPTFNTGIRIGNAAFIEKAGTTDHVFIGGVQVDV